MFNYKRVPLLNPVNIRKQKVDFSYIQFICIHAFIETIIHKAFMRQFPNSSSV